MAMVLLLACLVLAACTSTTGSSTTITTPPGATSPTSTTTTEGLVDLSARPVVWLQPLPERSDPSLPFADGSEDFYDLFASDSPWTDAAAHTQVFGIYSTYVRHYANDQELLNVIDGVKERGMALAMEVGPLPAPTDDTCVGAESYGGADEIELIRRIKRLGGTLDIIALDEPYAFGHKANGPTDCQRPTEQVAAEVADFVTLVRQEMPNVVVGDIEPMWARPEIGVDDMSTWFDAYREVSGEDFAFIHLDAEWARPDWPQVFLAVEGSARQRGISVGVIYNGGDAGSDQEWTDLTAERMYTYEQVWGGRPDQVVFQSWNDHPHRVLPETDPSTLTSLIDRYFGVRTAITLNDTVSAETGALALDVSLHAEDGSPIASAPLSVDVTPVDGQAADIAISGVVPEDVTEAVVVFRVNTEGAGPGTADMRIYEVGYREGDSDENKVADPRFEQGLEAWAPYGEGVATVRPSDQGPGAMLELSTAEGQPLNVDSTSTITVTPNSEFVLSCTAGIPPDSSGSGYVSVVFLRGGSEVARVISDLTAPPIRLGVVATDESGRLTIDANGLQPGAYDLRIAYPGDLDHWGAYLASQVEVG
ncbi:MAG: hypothetical protein WAN34_08545 [Acidimicrobiia bacterium]